MVLEDIPQAVLDLETHAAETFDPPPPPSPLAEDAWPRHSIIKQRTSRREVGGRPKVRMVIWLKTNERVY